MCDGLGAALLPHVSLARQEQRLLEGAGIYAAAKWKCFDVVVLIQLPRTCDTGIEPKAVPRLLGGKR